MVRQRWCKAMWRWSQEREIVCTQIVPKHIYPLPFLFNSNICFKREKVSALGIDSDREILQIYIDIYICILIRCLDTDVENIFVRHQSTVSVNRIQARA